MKRTTIPVLLVVLTLLCGFIASAAVADTADQDDGAMLVPANSQHHNSDQILDLYGDANDGGDGDPGTAGDGFGLRGDDSILPTYDSNTAAHDQRLMELLMRLMDYFTLLH